MMKKRIVIAVFCVLTLGEVASAGWDNVFQVACFHCRRDRIRTSFFAPRHAPVPVVAASPPVQRITRYEEQCEYEPVTVMRPESFKEPVQVQERRSYYEPVTTYTTRSYYNPETCKTESYQIPCTTMVRREECNTVTQYVERVRMIPVETRRKVCYSRPVITTTQYGPTTKRYECDNCDVPPATTPAPLGAPGGVPPGAMPSERIDPTITPGVSQQRPSRMPAPPVRAEPSRPFTARSVSRNAGVQGEVVTADRQTPRPNTKVVFMNDADRNVRVTAMTDDFGQFDARLPVGKWNVYLSNGDGTASLYQTVDIEADGKQLQVVSR